MPWINFILHYAIMWLVPQEGMLRLEPTRSIPFLYISLCLYKIFFFYFILTTQKPHLFRQRVSISLGKKDRHLLNKMNDQESIASSVEGCICPPGASPVRVPGGVLCLHLAERDKPVWAIKLGTSPEKNSKSRSDCWELSLGPLEKAVSALKCWDISPALKPVL